MEQTVVEELGMRMDGTLIKRIMFINTDSTNYMLKAQSYFSAEDKKMAKKLHKYHTSSTEY